MSDGDGYTPADRHSGISCYSENEGGFMSWSQSLRGRLLKPVLSWMAALGLRGDHVTLGSMIAGLAFCPFLLLGETITAFVMLFLHVLLDGLDGPLARYRKQASNRGSFTDTMADQVVVAATALTMIRAEYAAPWPAGLYLFLYTVVVAFAFVRNAMATPYSWLFRPRFLIYFWFLIEAYFWPGSLDPMLWVASALLALKCLTGFITIRNRME